MPAVLCPGCGLGRLPFELAARGYAAQGNEFSYHMLLGSHLILNRCAEIECHTIFPYVLSTAHRAGKSDHLRAVKIPDVCPRNALGDDSELSMATGEFIEVYKDQEAEWDAMATVFFLDTAKNVFLYIRIIAHVVKPGGLWINLGPLLYHYADIQEERSIEPSWEEVRAEIVKYFDIIEEDRRVARDVLYLCLDWSLRLMHPLLPYLTEELYQRLPDSPTKHKSIVIAPYPTQVNAWYNVQVEADMEVVSEIAKHFRSQKTSLGMPPGARPKGFVRHTDADTLCRLKGLATRLSRMGAIGDVQVLDDGAEAPKGSIKDVVNTQCLIFLEVAGVDLSQELTKFQKKIDSAKKMVESYEKKMNAPGYEEKVPKEVRDMNAQKMEASQKECEELKSALANIQAAMK
uniref:carnosine N-methyltransferase n=1 Tax=Strombidinopsis acuminata TaxID=141414 RepID=A0A7S3SBK3_9SPIT